MKILMREKFYEITFPLFFRPSLCLCCRRFSSFPVAIELLMVNMIDRFFILIVHWWHQEQINVELLQRRHKSRNKQDVLSEWSVLRIQKESWVLKKQKNWVLCDHKRIQKAMPIIGFWKEEKYVGRQDCV